VAEHLSEALGQTYTPAVKDLRCNGEDLHLATATGVFEDVRFNQRRNKDDEALGHNNTPRFAIF